MIDWSARFNALPDDVRMIGCAMEARLRIQMLLAERDRIRSRTRKSISEINDWIRNCEERLNELEKKEQQL